MACVLSAQKNRLNETVLSSAHNICFGLQNFNSFIFITQDYLEACRAPSEDYDQL